MTAEEITHNSVRGDKADVNAIASVGKDNAAVMVWNYHDDDLPAPASDVHLELKGISAKRVLITHYRIDKEYSNSYEVWKKMGSPQNPTPEQYAILERSGQLELFTSPVWVDVMENEVTLDFKLPRHGVSLVKVTNM
jgi:xylan 1,4-beta-xylosidase